MSTGQRLRMAPVPVHGPHQSFPHVDGRSPPGQLAQLRAVHELAIDLASRRGGAANVGLELGARRLAHELDDLAHRPWPTAAGVERLAAGARAVVVVERAGNREVRLDGVLDVEVVAL